jgi:tetratricopeptide (TPR) repeat protein
MLDALKTFQELKDKTDWMVQIEGGYGEALTLAGRGDEASPYLNDALGLSRQLKNQGLESQVLVFQGNVPYYRGDSKSAKALYEQALQAATRSKEPERILIAKVALAKISAPEGSLPQAISSFHKLMQEADDQGVPNVSVECSIYMAEAMIRNHDNERARQELERALQRADKIGLKPLSVKAHYLLGNAMRASGNELEAQQHYLTTTQMLDDMRKEPGSDKILQRSDFKTMYEEATRLSQSASQ